MNTMTTDEIAQNIATEPTWTGLTPRQLIEAGRWQNLPEYIASLLCEQRLYSLTGAEIHAAYGGQEWMDDDFDLSFEGGDEQTYMAWAEEIKAKVLEIVEGWEVAS